MTQQPLDPNSPSRRVLVVLTERVYTQVPLSGSFSGLVRNLLEAWLSGSPQPKPKPAQPKPADFEQRVGEEVRRRIAAADDEARKQLKEANRRLLEFQQMIGQRAVFTRTEFRHLLMAVHPDNTASTEVRNRLLDLLVKHETRLVKVDPKPKK